jgi:hypothetical protein
MSCNVYKNLVQKRTVGDPFMISYGTGLSVLHNELPNCVNGAHSYRNPKSSMIFDFWLAEWTRTEGIIYSRIYPAGWIRRNNGC